MLSRGFSFPAFVIGVAFFLHVVNPVNLPASSGIAEAHISYKKAIGLLDAGKEREAAAEMVRAVTALPEVTTAAKEPCKRSREHYLKGIRCLQSRYDSLAEKEFRKALEIEPGNAASRYQLAFLLGNKGDYRPMFEEFWKALHIRPVASEKMRGLAGLSLLAMQVPRAITYYREALSKDPSSIVIMRMLGLVLAESGEKREGLDLLEEALKRMPDDYSSLSAMGLTCALNGDYERSREYLNKAIAINPRHPEALGRLGLVFLLEGRTEESIEILREAVSLNPGVGQLHGNLAKAYKLAGRLDDAAGQYELALKSDPRNYEAWYEMGNIFSAQGRLERALESYRRAESIKPNFAALHYKMGLLLARNEKYDDAEAQFKKAIRANCDYASAYYLLAILNQEHKKDYRGAAHYYRMYLLYDKTSERAERAKRWLRQGREKKAN